MEKGKPFLSGVVILVSHLKQFFPALNSAGIMRRLFFIHLENILSISLDTVYKRDIV